MKVMALKSSNLHKGLNGPEIECSKDWEKVKSADVLSAREKLNQLKLLTLNCSQSYISLNDDIPIKYSLPDRPCKK